MKIALVIQLKKLKSKSSYGYDEISNNLIKHASSSLVKPLTLIVNQVLYTGIFPRQLKTSRVKPIHKNGEQSSFCNYRPIFYYRQCLKYLIILYSIN